jgi:hypothetical protein
MGHFWRDIVHYVNRMGPNEWFVVLAVMIVVGVVCMRGFGSRSRY